MTDNELENMREQLQAFDIIYGYLRVYSRQRVMKLIGIGGMIVRMMDQIAKIKGDTDEW